MFKKFESNNVSGITQLKSSVQKLVRNKILEQYPLLNDHIDKIIPKKDTIKIVKCHEHIEILTNGLGEFLFFRHYEGDYIPCLKLIHKYPFICPLMQVDKGAIQFVLQGANVMCPGLTSKGAIMTPNVPEGSLVTIVAEDKQHAIAIGKMKMTPENILKINKGIGIESLHYLNDGLWRLKPVK